MDLVFAIKEQSDHDYVKSFKQHGRQSDTTSGISNRKVTPCMYYECVNYSAGDSALQREHQKKEKNYNY